MKQSKMLSVTAVILIGIVTCVLSSCDGCYRDCLAILKDAKSRGKTVCNGVYTIEPDSYPPFKVYCDMKTDGGGWTVFQRRMDGSQDFYLYWKDYQYGFGNLEREFWLGLDYIQRLTVPNSELRVDLEKFNNDKEYAQYSLFRVGNALTNYTATIQGYNGGHAGDSFGYHNGMKFSTRDRDNDETELSCAKYSKGGWWYKNCHHANLNGLYLYGQHKSFSDGINWTYFTGYYYSLKFTEMKIRRL